jgi:hypothetical protein
MLVHEIVFVGRAEFVERLGHLGFLGDGDVLPDLAVGKLHLGLDWAVGIDAVARMQQEIRAMLAHGGKGEHAAVVRIDAPALARDVAAPDETDVATIGRRGAETANHCLALDVDMRQVAEADAVENVLAGGQVFQEHLGGKIALGQCRDRRQRPRIGKRFGGRELNHHLRRAVRARPDHAAIGADVAGLHAMGDDRPVGGAAEIGHRDDSGAGRGRGGEEFSAGNLAGKSQIHGSLLGPARVSTDRPRKFL